jgi:protocatechuate 4,5-dioxygenase beta chain
MGRLAAAIAVSHVPSHTAYPEMAPPEKLRAIRAAWAALKDRLAQAAPDLVVAVSNDHFQNFFPVQPPFCVGTAETHVMPAEVNAKPLKLESRMVAGNPDFAAHLLRTAEAAGAPLAFSDEIVFMDEISIPQRFLDPDNRIPVVPILTNCLNRHQPTPRSFFALGALIARAIADEPGNRRIAVIATGGLSHDPLGPNWCLVDEAFDRRFLALLESGDTERLFGEYTLARILEPGKGGTPELLNWFTALGAVGAGRKAQVLCYESVPEWATGVGYAAWPVGG